MFFAVFLYSHIKHQKFISKENVGQDSTLIVIQKLRVEKESFENEWAKQSGFSLGRLHMGGICPGGGTSAGGQSVNGGTHEGGHRPYGGT